MDLRQEVVRLCHVLGRRFRSGLHVASRRSPVSGAGHPPDGADPVCALLSFTPIQRDQGTDSPYSIATFNAETFFYGTNGFASIGREGLKQIGDEFVDRWFLENCNLARLNVIRGVVDPVKGRYFVLFPSSSNTTNVLDQILCYDIALQEVDPRRGRGNLPVSGCLAGPVARGYRGDLSDT